MDGKKNLLVMQSGGPTPVVNRSLFGVYAEAVKLGGFADILGARRGIEGVLADRVVDLRSISESAWRSIARTPGAALGSTRRKLGEDDLAAVMEFIARRGITHCFMIGGNDSAETALAISAAAREAGHDLSVMHVPKTVDNDLVETDHTPGYGSAARFTVAAVQGAGLDAEAMGAAAPVTVLEVAGRDSGWLAAASVAGKRDTRDAPHVVIMPETPFDLTRVLTQIEDACSKYGFALAVVQENVRGADGRVLGASADPIHVDDFGHSYYEGAGKYVSQEAAARLGVRTRYDRPGSIQRSMAALVSRLDAQEAEIVGRAAVGFSLDGETERMISIVRTGKDPYSSITVPTPLDQVVGAVKTVPPEFIDSEQMPNAAFLEYVRPLIGDPLPAFGRIDG